MTRRLKGGGTRNLIAGSLVALTLTLGFAGKALADFMIASAIVEFTDAGPRQQDIELVSRSKDKDYIETQISEIVDPGQKDETRRVIEDPAQGGLLVTPDKTVLAGGGRRVLRFVLLKDPDDRDHIYRVAIKPVIKGLDSSGKIGLKILVGYEALVIVRPVHPDAKYSATRSGKILTIENTGNTNILFQNGKQCDAANNCTTLPVMRAYAGTTTHIDLPRDASIVYSVWDGTETIEKTF
jgi:P pilus assembly chaperone PapD